jgi:hypothetical protein
MLSESFAIINSHSPAADRYNANPVGDYINGKLFDRVEFLLAQATGGTNTGTAVVTVRAASDATGTGAEAVPFKYRKKTTGASAVMGAITDVTTAGFTTTANEDTIYEIEVEMTALPATKPFLALLLTEGVNDPVTACAIAIGVCARYQATSMPDPLS